MGRAAIGFRPRVFACVECRQVSEAFGRDQALEGCQPMMIVTRPVVGLAAPGGGLEFSGESGRPFLPGKVSLIRELDDEREGLRLPGLGKYRPALIAGQSWQRREAFSVR